MIGLLINKSKKEQYKSFLQIARLLNHVPILSRNKIQSCDPGGSQYLWITKNIDIPCLMSK